MNNLWSLDTHGDPLGKLHDFIKYAWQASDLVGMLFTLGEDTDIHASPRFITDLAAINQVNPFKPLMELNAARLVPGLLAEHPQGKIGALLRPCELRALVEMTKHTPLNLERLLTISVDCLGSLPADEYQWRLERMSTLQSANAVQDELAQETINFSRQGGIIPYRYRSACQVCASPAAQSADINLHVLGLPVRQVILVSTKDSKTAESINIEGYANGKADQALATQHERVLSRMIERHSRHMDQLKLELGSLLPASVDSLIHQLEACGDCQNCLDACPICSVDRPIQDADGHYERSTVMRWLISCAGCGMCEQACPNHLPTAAIFAVIRQLLAEQWDYVPGRSLQDQLPLL